MASSLAENIQVTSQAAGLSQDDWNLGPEHQRAGIAAGHHPGEQAQPRYLLQSLRRLQLNLHLVCRQKVHDRWRLRQR